MGTPSLLDVIEAREKQEGSIDCLTHLCYVAMVSDISAAIGFHENIMGKYARGSGTSTRNCATGMLLYQEGVLLHYVEAPAAVTTEILVAVQEQRRADKSWSSVRILVASEGCTLRYFDSWFRPPQQMVADEGEIPPPAGDEATELAFDLICSLGDLGSKFRQTGDGISGGVDWAQESKGPSSLPKTAHAMINAACPTVSHLRAFATSDAFLDVAEFLQLFDAPISVHLHSEVTWPHQPTIDFSGMS